jgi:hypothetical protein
MNESTINPGCTGKTPYTNKADALRCLRFREKARRNRASKGRGAMQPYQCRHCGSWHLGSQATREAFR